MSDGEDLQRGRPSAPTAGFAYPLSADNGNTISSKQAAVNRAVDAKLADLYAKHDSLLANTIGRQREVAAKVEEIDTRLLMTERKERMQDVWLWFLGALALIEGISITVLWIVVGAR